ncbi:hypothetical protein MKS88_002549 [Plasmodium brasilianum]|uniref:Uncharacterized protein n=1 Tax=Plasmodium brasilianum TaxID=5824 RepID=A0ACB9YBP6_PLABR|nr:hypothetical protein MKS88_002549 [Plasmodium brasilianum]
MQKFSKYAYHKIINNDNHNTNKIINRPFNHIFLHYQVIQENIHEKCKFLLTDCKPFNILKDYIVEKKHIANEKWKKEKKTFSHINCKNEVTYYRKNNVDNVSISHNLYASLKNIFVLIDKINRFLVVNNLQKCRNISPCRIVEYNVYINERLYLFCLHVPDEFVNETLHEIEKILRDKDFVELCREIKNLNFNELASFFNIYNNIIGKKYNEQCDNNFKIFFFFQDVEKFILQNLCISIHNIITNANNKIIHNENISKKYSSSNKINFHRMYMEILSILNVLKNNNKLYVNFIDFILFIQFKAVYKHNHHYNYSYSINLIQVIHKVLFSQLNYLYTTKPYEEEEFIYENFFTVLNDNYFYIEKEKFTWNYIEKHYEDIKPYRSLRTTSLGSRDIKKKNIDLDEDRKNKNFSRCVQEKNCSHSENHLYNDGKYYPTQNDNKNELKRSDNKNACYQKKLLNCSEYVNTDDLTYNCKNAYFLINITENEYKRISKGIEDLYLLHYGIILLTIIVKKIKYMENRNALIDEVRILRTVNILMHVNNTKLINLNKLINEKATFLKEFSSIQCGKESLNFLLFVDFIFNTLKNVKYDNKCIKRITQEYDTNKYFLEILSLASIKHYSVKSNIISENEASTDEMEKNEKKIISKINRNINFLTSEIILTFSNYTTSSPYSCNDISCNDDMTTIYMSYIFNDLYFQNNHKIIKFVFSYFLKHFKDINSVLKLNKINIYFQYITIYNFLKLFKNEVNKPSTEYHNVLKMFMECFDNNLYHKVNEDSSFNNIHDNNSDGIFYVDIKIEQYLHFLNKLWYFYFLSKKLITNCEFLSHFNYHFYLTFHMINQYVQKYMNNSELFTIFVNKCINKITGILVIQKYFNIYIEEDLIKHLSKIIYLAHNIISRENKRKILMYILPFIKQPKRNMDNLKNFLIDKEIAQNGVNNILLNNYKKDELHIYKCEKEEKRISFVQQVKSNICEERKKTNFNHNPCNDYEQYEKYNLNEMLLYLGCKKKNIAQIIEKLEKNKNYKINNNELYELLSEHMKECILIKKENVILKNKLNYIVLNFEKFISSYVSGIVSNKSLFMEENGYNHMNSTGCNNIVAKMEECNSILKGEYNTKEGNEMVVVNEDENPHNISIKFDYHQVKVKNEYFYELKKYENQSNIKINNILINMYMYNPHICAKNKNSFISKHKTKQKKMIILPYDTYKNIKKLVIYNDCESVNLFKRLNNSIYLLFLKMKFFFNKTN